MKFMYLLLGTFFVGCMWDSVLFKARKRPVSRADVVKNKMLSCMS